MKRLITLAICCVSVFYLSAQNPMFCSFESHFGVVLNWLEAKSNAQIIELSSNRKILVEYHAASYEYLFNSGMLYEIRMRRVFATRKEGKEAYDGCMRYFKMISPQGSEFKNGSGKSCQIRESRGKLYDLLLHKLDSEHEVFELLLSAKDPRLMPIEGQNTLDDRYYLEENRTQNLLWEAIKSHRLNFL